MSDIFNPTPEENAANGSISNTTALQLPKWRVALAKVRDGTANARILYVGDSTTAGYGSTLENSFPTRGSRVARLATMLNSSVTPAVLSLGIPQSAITGNADNRWTLGSGWTLQAFGAAMNASYRGTNASGNLVFTPNVNCDSFYVYYLASVSQINGTLTATATGGTPVAINSALATGTFRILVTAASASINNTITFAGTGSGFVYVVGVEPVLSAQPQILMGNAGVNGSTTTQWATSGNYGGLQFIEAVAPDLTIISLGINDASVPVAVSTVIANLQAIITAAQISGDVVLETMIPSQTGTAYTNELIYVPQYANLAQMNNLLFLDIFARFGSSWNAALMNASTPLHPNDLGYWDWAQAESEVIVPDYAPGINSGLGTISTQNANAVVITGGTIDGTAIGSTTASTGKFTTINATTATSAYQINGANAVSFPANDTTSGASIAIGSGALSTLAATAAYQSTAVGYQALNASITTAGVQNTAFGYQALKNVTSGTRNIGIGDSAGTNVLSGGSNTFIGHGSGGGAGGTLTGSNNTGIGPGTLNAVTTSTASNTAVGSNAGNKVTGSSNTIIGANVASATLTTGTGNILIGTSSTIDTAASGTSNTLNIGGAITASGLGSTPVIQIPNTISSYNGVATVARGVPSLVAVVNLTNQAAAIVATTIYTTTTAGFYRVSYVASVTQSATSSSILGGATGFQTRWTSQTDTVVKTTSPTTATVSSGNTTATAISGSTLIYASAASVIQYLMGYTNVGVTVMQYELNITVEAL